MISRLGKAMRSQRLTQLELAELSGLSQGHISELVRGRKTPDVITALRLAKALGVRVEYLWRLERGE